MLPVLIGAVIGAVAYSCLADEDSSKGSCLIEEKEEEDSGLNLEESAEALKNMVFKARKNLFAQREEALARHDTATVRKMDRNLVLMEEYLDKITRIVDGVLEKCSEADTEDVPKDGSEKEDMRLLPWIKKPKTEEAGKDQADETEAEVAKPVGKKAKDVDAIIRILSESVKKMQEET